MQLFLPRILILCFAVIVLAGPPSAVASPVTMNLTSGGPYVMAGIYVGPYTATIDGVPFQVICDDFLDESNLQQPWLATVNSPSTVLTNGKFANPFYGLSPNKVKEGYAEVSYLTLQMLQAIQANPADATTVGELSFAIWNVFDPGHNGALAYLGGHESSSVYAGAQDFYNGALNAYSTTPAQLLADIDQFTMYTPSPSNGPPQEFFVRTPGPAPIPEPGTVSLLLSGMLALTGPNVAWRIRRAARTRGLRFRSH